MKLSKRVLEERRTPLQLAWEPLMTREEIAVEVAQLEAENERLREELEQWRNPPKTLGDIARETLGTNF